jgi:hypothetical protein
MLVLPSGGFYDVYRLEELRWHDVHTKFHEIWFRHSKGFKGEYTYRHTDNMAVS